MKIYIYVCSISIKILFFKINIDPCFVHAQEQRDSYVIFGKATKMVIKTVYLY